MYLELFRLGVVKNFCSPKHCPYLISAVVMAFRSKLTEWIPRSQNEQADFLSLIFDSDDWGLSPLSFHRIDLVWGPHSVDRFANHVNAKLSRFNTRFWNPGSQGINAFVMNWDGEKQLCMPAYLSYSTLLTSYA